jgi:hypothetical protein
MATEARSAGSAAWNGAGASPFDDRGDEPASFGQQALAAGMSVLAVLRDQPSLVLGVLAAVLGALIGTWLANRFAARPAVSDLPGADGASRLADTVGRAATRLSDVAGEQAESARDAATRGASRIAAGGRRARRRGEDLGSSIADRGPDVERVGEQIQAGLSLLPLALKLLSNPIVRYYLRRALARRFGR